MERMGVHFPMSSDRLKRTLQRLVLQEEEPGSSLPARRPLSRRAWQGPSPGCHQGPERESVHGRAQQGPLTRECGGIVNVESGTCFSPRQRRGQLRGTLLSEFG